MTAADLCRAGLRRPALRAAALLGLALAGLPWSAPLFHALFPDLARPVYTRASFFALALAHVELVVVSTGAAALAGVGLAVVATRRFGRDFAPLLGAAAAAGQVVPPVAVLALAVPMLGYGAAPTLAALGLYAVLPILEGALTGLASVPAAAREAAQALGFSPRGLLLRVELPLAAPFIVAGLRAAFIVNVGTAAIGSTVGALSLGSPIVEGLAAQNPAYVLQGALLVALLAVFFDRAFAAAEAVVRARVI
ncbi:ABC transporter permease [Methylocella sp.]|uniref:ABC transporter permease n=1 Tax=Methylocella sp. TaxID=1978226 RepID=UPI003784BA81